MSKAALTTTTIGEASTTERATSTSLTRRRLLAGSSLGAALAIVGLPIAAEAEPIFDPVVTLYAKWRVAEDAIAVVETQQTALRGAFVSRYGEMLKPGSDVDGWRNDPRLRQLGDLTEAVNDLCNESTALIDAMMATPATSLEGIRCKMIVGLDVWKFIERPNVEVEYHDDMTVAFLRDAVRVLGGSAGV